jgi:DNA-binding IscR family transcriptional regulator
MTRDPVGLTLAAVQLVHKKPRDAKELSGLLGISIVYSRKLLSRMEEEGLVNRKQGHNKGEEGSKPHVFTWERNQ